MKNTFNKNKGFTIIETLVAIAILMIAIAGPLTIAQKSLSSSVQARDQVTASFLAQDAMEYIKNIRDNNMIAGGDWLAGFGNCLGEDNICIVNTDNENEEENGIVDGPSIVARLCILTEGGRYAHNSDCANRGVKSIFSRVFYITPVPGNPQEATVTVEVTWQNGIIPNELKLNNQIFEVVL